MSKDKPSRAKAQDELQLPEALKDPMGVAARYERTHKKNAHAEAALLRNVGEKLKDDGFEYLGSVAVHVYRHTLDKTQCGIKSQTSDLAEIPAHVFQAAIRELGRTCMIAYGHEPPKRHDQSVDKFE